MVFQPFLTNENPNSGPVAHWVFLKKDKKPWTYIPINDSLLLYNWQNSFSQYLITDKRIIHMITAYFTKLALMSQQLFFILLGFFGMGFLIGFHELGHFLFAKLFKIRVPSFSLGFGPKIVSKKIGETEFCLSALPFAQTTSSSLWYGSPPLAFWKRIALLLLWSASLPYQW